MLKQTTKGRGKGVVNTWCTAVCVNLAIFVWSTNEECACSKFKSLCCVDNFLFCTHALFTFGDSNFARLTQTAVRASRTNTLALNAHAQGYR